MPFPTRLPLVVGATYDERTVHATLVVIVNLYDTVLVVQDVMTPRWHSFAARLTFLSRLLLLFNVIEVFQWRRRRWEDLQVGYGWHKIFQRLQRRYR